MYSHDAAHLHAPSKKGLHLPFSLAKNRIYLDTYLKEELTDLFWEPLECSLFPQAEYKETDEPFYYSRT